MAQWVRVLALKRAVILSTDKRSWVWLHMPVTSVLVGRRQEASGAHGQSVRDPVLRQLRRRAMEGEARHCLLNMWMCTSMCRYYVCNTPPTHLSILKIKIKRIKNCSGKRFRKACIGLRRDCT